MIIAPGFHIGTYNFTLMKADKTESIIYIINTSCNNTVEKQMNLFSAKHKTMHSHIVHS